MGQQNLPEDFAPILLLESSSEDSSPIIFYDDIDLNDSSSQLPVIQVPPAGRKLRGYRAIEFHLGQSTALSGAFKDTYGYCFSVESENRLLSFLDGTADMDYLKRLDEQCFTQWGLISFGKQIEAIYYSQEADKLGCILLASLMPKYCEQYRRVYGETEDVHQVWKEEDRIICSFISEINALRCNPTRQEYYQRC
jgi:hypothetical protein